jgi:GTP cyclohydrolase FolE2
VSSSVAPIVPIRDVDLPDVQAEPPAIALALDEAGISELRYPVTVHLADGSQQATVASVSFAASVAAETRGVHMSRFVETLHVWRNRIGVQELLPLLYELADRLKATAAQARLEFPLFLERQGPISGGAALVPYDCSLEGRLAANGAQCSLTVRVPITSLCPCSREISDYGAHNQRGVISITVAFELADGIDAIDFIDLVGIAEEAGSAPVYSLLKRTDERYVTMRAYENPAFVEDITRAVAARLVEDARIDSGRVLVVNEESIHSHNAFATVRWGDTSR